MNGETRHPQLGAGEKFAESSDYSDKCRLPYGLFIRWETIETPDLDAWTENELFCEAYGFRPNGPRSDGPDGKPRDVLNHGIYAKDLNGETMDVLNQAMLDELGIEIEVTSDDEDGDTEVSE